MTRPRPLESNPRAISTQGRDRSLLRRFKKDQDGGTAVEFAMVSMPFFALLFAIFETALAFLTTQMLETAVSNAARQIYTGQFQQDAKNAGQTPSQLANNFRTAVCDNVTALFDCQNTLKVDIRTFTSFPDAAVPTPITNGQFDSSGFGYQPPGPDQIVVVRAAMEYPVIVPITQFGNLSNGNRLVMASATFRTEPFPSAK
jgi:Flp pilus assembly protein TadG